MSAASNNVVSSCARAERPFSALRTSYPSLVRRSFSNARIWSSSSINRILKGPTTPVQNLANLLVQLLERKRLVNQIQATVRKSAVCQSFIRVTGHEQNTHLGTYCLGR